jgi:hypothetical protein
MCVFVSYWYPMTNELKDSDDSRCASFSQSDISLGNIPLLYPTLNHRLHISGMFLRLLPLFVLRKATSFTAFFLGCGSFCAFLPGAFFLDNVVTRVTILPKRNVHTVIEV